MRSGIGAAEELTAAGVETAVDLPGVAKNLQNHAILFIAAMYGALSATGGGSRQVQASDAPFTPRAAPE